MTGPVSMVGEVKGLWRAAVDRFTRLSGRSLRPTTSGRMVLLMAFAVGFAAMNTGNNLLFFGWGLILSSIVISGILSESTLQSATATPLPPEELRAGQQDGLPVLVENRRKLPGFGVEISLVFHSRRAQAARAGAAGARGDADSLPLSTVGDVWTGTAFELRLSPGARHQALVPFAPADRGVLDVKSLRVATAAPFGFFAKERIVDGDKLQLASVVVLPERVDTRALGKALWARLGEYPAGHAGNGDELFSMRPFRSGDDPRRIAWRRAAKTGRLVVRENEATRSREIIVDVRVGGADVVAAEDAVATAGSLVEDLLADGHSVGVRAPGLLVQPSRSPRQRYACLHGLALWERPPDGAASSERAGGAAVIAVVALSAGAGDARADGADVVVKAIRRRSLDRVKPRPA